MKTIKILLRKLLVETPAWVQALLILSFMSSYQLLKHCIFPDLSMTQSNISTIVLTTVLGTLATYAYKQYIGKLGNLESVNSVLEEERKFKSRIETTYEFEHKKLAELLRFLAQNGSALEYYFFKSLVDYLANFLDVDFVSIDKVEENGSFACVQTTSQHHSDMVGLRYTLQSSPFGSVPKLPVVCFPENVRRIFPEDEMLQILEAEGFVGVPLWNTNGTILGLISIVKGSAIENTRFVEEVLQIVSIGVSGEMERERNVEKLQDYAHELYVRNNELSCLYGISKAIERSDAPLHDILVKVIKAIEATWLYPNVTKARIIVDEVSYTSDDFVESKWFRTIIIGSHEDKLGKLEVHYMEQRPFLDEENNLLKAIAFRLEKLIRYKRTECALFESEATLQRIIDDAPVPMAIVNEQLDIDFLNKKFTDLLGYKQEEIPTIEDWWLCAYPDPVYREKVKKKWYTRFGQAVTHKSEINGRESYVTCKDGTVRHINFRMSPIHKRNLLVLHDITDLRRAEKEVKQIGKELETIFNLVPVTIWYKDTKNNILRVNKAAADLIGLSVEAIEGCSTQDIVPKHAAQYYEDDLEVINSGQPQLGLVREMETAKGVTRYVRMDKLPITNDEGVIVGVLAVSTDITDQKHSDEKIIQQNEFLTQIIESMTHPFYVVDAENYEIKIANSAVCRLDEMETDFAQGCTCLLHEVKDAKKSVVQEYESRDKEGNKHYFEVHAFPIFDQAESVKQIIKHVIDITERKKIESVKSKVEAQLRHAQKMEAIGTLAGGIAHDFNNILAAIMGYTEIALLNLKGKNQVQTDRIQRDMKEVLQAAHRAKDLVKQILSFSRHGQDIEMRPISLEAIIDEVMKLIRASLPSTIDLRQEVQCVSSQVVGNASQIHQVILNLCTNSAQALGENPGVLTIRLNDVYVDSEFTKLHPDIKPGAYIKLSVIDTGHGIDATTIERIFEPYFTTKETGKGSGLGLAIVQSIVKAHGGMITVYSEVGKCTVFDVFLPKIEKEVQQEPEDESPLPRGSEHILLVDDEEILVKMIGRMLEGLGYRVTTSTDCADAISLMANDPDLFGIVITDYTMPLMTGVALKNEIRKIRPDIPIILCTGYSERISEEKAKAMGIQAFMMKPLSTRSIANTIRKILDPPADATPVKEVEP
jgi:PAS domain S-box-containing protein